MKAGLIWVEGLAQTYTLAGVSYGPSTKPLQIPAGLVDALGLEEVDSPEGDSTEVTLLGDTQAALRTLGQAQQQIGELFPEQFRPGDILTKAGGPHPIVEAVKALKAERDDLKLDVKRKVEIIEHGSADNRRLRDEAGRASENSFRLSGELDELKAQVARERASWEAERTATQPAAAPAIDEATPEAEPAQQMPSTQPDVVAAPASDGTGQASPEDPSQAGEGDADQGDEAAAPGDVDQRTKTQLKAALDAANVPYDSKANHPTLLALASENKV